MNKKALVILADGFEEIEAITPIDILKRVGVEVIMAGLGGTSIKSTRGVTISADMELDKVAFVPDVIIFPGGMPGAENLANSPKVKDLIKSVDSEGKLIAAICASPAYVLAPTGVLDGKKATGYPGTEDKFPSSTKISSEDVVRDGNVITSRGPGTAASFAFMIANELVGSEKARKVAEGMLFA